MQIYRDFFCHSDPPEAEKNLNSISVRSGILRRTQDDRP